MVVDTDIGLKDWHQEDQEELENGAHGGRIRNELGEERDITDPKLQTLDGTKRIQISRINASPRYLVLAFLSVVSISSSMCSYWYIIGSV